MAVTSANGASYYVNAKFSIAGMDKRKLDSYNRRNIDFRPGNIYFADSIPIGG